MSTAVQSGARDGEAVQVKLIGKIRFGCNLGEIRQSAVK